MAKNDGTVRSSLRGLQRRWDRLKLSTKARLGLFEPLELVAYLSHGREDRLRVIGRVVERTGVRSPDEPGSVIRNILNTIHRFESDEIPDARLRARFEELSVEEVTDSEGYFEITLEPESPLGAGWHDVQLEILDSMAGGAGESATAEVLIPSPDAEFAIVSDMDDTVIRTGATDMLTELRIVLSKSARTRSAMPGASPLYRALEAGPDRSGENPFFYVSLSGWGLYDLFVKFLQHNELPKGPLFLQDLAIIEEKSDVLGSENHKRDTIDRLMDDYPNLPFVLIGDSGQSDPETYRDIVRDRADRVRAVLVRDVTSESRDREVRKIAQEVEDMGVQMAAAESSVSLARAAADFGLIHHDTIAEVRRAMVDVQEDDD